MDLSVEEEVESIELLIEGVELSVDEKAES